MARLSSFVRLKFEDYLKMKDVLVENKDPGVKLHLSHLEDLVIENGAEGFKQFEEQVSNLLNFLMGLSSSVKLHAKIDGSPAIFFGSDPRPEFKGHFFVATKSAFNVGLPKINHSVEEVDRNHTGALADKLKNAFIALREVYDGSNLIYQGDMLFSQPQEKSIQNVDGTEYLMFRPNVLVYAIPVDPQSELFNRVNNANFGIVLHDSFRGIAINDGKAIKVTPAGQNFKKIIAVGEAKNVFIEDSDYPSVSVKVNSVDRTEILSQLKQAREYLLDVDGSFDQIWKKSPVLPLLKNYLNYQVRQPNGGIFRQAAKGESFVLNGFKKGFSAFLKEKFASDEDQIKAFAKRDTILKWIDANAADFSRLLHATYLMIQVKNRLLKIVSQVESKLGQNFYQNPDGSFDLTKGEGFVSFVGPNQVKLVDRLDFSKMNFMKGLKESKAPAILKEQRAQLITIGFFPGSFKPPHIGHYAVAKQAIQENDYFHVYIGQTERPPITAAMADYIWKIFADKLIQTFNYHGWVQAVTSKTPVRTVYLEVDELNSKPNANQYLVNLYANKEDMERFERMKKYTGNLAGVNFKETPRIMSASQVRDAIQRKNWQEVSGYFPAEVDVDAIIKYLQANT